MGTVEAQDKDLGENAVVYYSVPEEFPFEINELSGQIKTKQELDFETQDLYYLTVLAQDKDGEESGKSATATVTILVQDTSDEIPLFEEKMYQASVPENTADESILTVKAIDKDISASITYEIVSGDKNLFKIDQNTGEINTVKGLDYELQRVHFLTISTEEARGALSIDQTTCMVEINVQDVNDNPPRFISVPLGKTVLVRNDAAIGSKIAILKATDPDGTEPGNIVKYKIIPEGSSDKAIEYFGINEDSGEVELLGDLTKEVYEEYRIEIMSYDLGTPQMESTVTLSLRIQQVVTMPPELGVGFTDLRYEVTIDEGIDIGRVAQVLELDQVPNPGLKIDCEAMKIRDDKGRLSNNIFKGKFNSDNQCELIVNEEIDKEEGIESYEVMVKLKTQSAFVNPARMISTVSISVEFITVLFVF